MISIIKKKLIGMISKVISDEIKEQIKLDLKKDVDFSLDMKKYELIESKGELTVWDTPLKFEIDEYSIKLEWKYLNGFTDEKLMKFKSLNELREHIINHKSSRGFNSDVAGLTEIDFLVWYTYKTSKRNLVVERFLDVSNKKLYSVKSYKDVLSLILKWIDLHPELLI